MKILTCNVRCFGARDGDNDWAHRKDACIEVMQAQAPDVVCCQEMWVQQFNDVSSALKGFASFGMADTPAGRHPQNCIFYRSDVFSLISAGGYWLSTTPHIAGSKSWDSDCVRLANWVRLEEHASGNEIRVVNTHLDHVSQPARENQARIVAEDASAYPAEYPQLLLGDMNCDFSNPAIGILKAAGWVDTYGSVNGTENPGHTYHAFQGEAHESAIGKMDWIFMRGNVRATAATVIKDAVGGRFPSDHYFVSATLKVG